MQQQQAAFLQAMSAELESDEDDEEEGHEGVKPDDQIMMTEKSASDQTIEGNGELLECVMCREKGGKCNPKRVK